MINDIVGRGLAMHVVEPHVMLLRFIARIDRDFSRTSELACEKAANECLAKRARAAGDEDPFVLERFY